MKRSLPLPQAFKRFVISAVRGSMDSCSPWRHQQIYEKRDGFWGPTAACTGEEEQNLTMISSRKQDHK